MNQFLDGPSFASWVVLFLLIHESRAAVVKGAERMPEYKEVTGSNPAEC